MQPEIKEASLSSATDFTSSSQILDAIIPEKNKHCPKIISSATCQGRARLPPNTVDAVPIKYEVRRSRKTIGEHAGAGCEIGH